MSVSETGGLRLRAGSRYELIVHRLEGHEGEFLQVLGTGAFGIVFAGRDHEARGRRVAVKLIRWWDTSDPQSWENQFAGEVGCVLSLQGTPGIAEYLEGGELGADECLTVSRSFMHGTPVGPLPTDRTVRYSRLQRKPWPPAANTDPTTASRASLRGAHSSGPHKLISRAPYLVMPDYERAFGVALGQAWETLKNRPDGRVGLWRLTLKLLCDLAFGLQELHRWGFTHLDLCAQNVHVDYIDPRRIPTPAGQRHVVRPDTLPTRMQATLIDFGLVRQAMRATDDATLLIAPGRDNWSAPEQRPCRRYPVQVTDATLETVEGKPAWVHVVLGDSRSRTPLGEVEAPPLSDSQAARAKALTPPELAAGDYLKTGRLLLRVAEIEQEPGVVRLRCHPAPLEQRGAGEIVPLSLSPEELLGELRGAPTVEFQRHVGMAADIFSFGLLIAWALAFDGDEQHGEFPAFVSALRRAAPEGRAAALREPIVKHAQQWLEREQLSEAFELVLRCCLREEGAFCRSHLEDSPQAAIDLHAALVACHDAFLTQVCCQPETVQRLQEELQTAQAEVTRLSPFEGQIRDVAPLLDEVERRSAQHDAELQQLRAQHAEEERRLRQDHERALATARGRLKTLQEELGRTRTDLAAQLQERSTQLEGERTSVEQLKRELADCQTRLEQREATLAEVREVIDPENSPLLERRETLREKIERLVAGSEEP